MADAVTDAEAGLDAGGLPSLSDTAVPAPERSTDEADAEAGLDLGTDEPARPYVAVATGEMRLVPGG